MNPDIEAMMKWDRGNILATFQMMAAICDWQTRQNVHPLTCWKNSQHILFPVLRGPRIILKCPECDYEQTHIPSVVVPK